MFRLGLARHHGSHGSPRCVHQVTQLRGQMEGLQFTESWLHRRRQPPNPALFDHHVHRTTQPPSAVALDEGAGHVVRQRGAGLAVERVFRATRCRDGRGIWARKHGGVETGGSVLASGVGYLESKKRYTIPNKLVVFVVTCSIL